ncbi:MAG TPA: PQQ-dependent sugar dehydrogenase, partial [Terriglobales bacterium]|nr:PQQ-dependent sugar dehydrogenase [Terriglobales bacterium]
MFALSIRRNLLPLLAVFVLLLASATAQTFSDPRFQAETVISVNPYSPIGVAFTPDGRMFIWEKSGVIRIFANGALLPAPFLDISARVNRYGDRGLIGLALDPEFASNGYVYLAYTFENGGDVQSSAARTQRITRITTNPADPNVALPGSEVVLLGKEVTLPCASGSDCIPNDAGTHTVDHLAFGKDGKLYVSIGDGATFAYASESSLRAQDLSSLNGKILRVNKDGTAPSDNPFFDGTDSPRSKVWSLGLRNPYRFTLEPTTGEIYIGDVGWDSYDELNRGRGMNFGWPCFEGETPQPIFQSTFERCRQISPAAVKPPFYTYDQSVGSSIVAGPFYTGAAFPPEYYGNLFFADYTGEFIRRVVVNAQGEIVEVKSFATDIPGVVFLTEGPDGNLYYVVFSTGEIKRIRFNSGSNQPPVAKAAGTPRYGLSPLDVNFSSAGSADPEGTALTYNWVFGDGESSAVANPQHRYVSTTARTFTATLTVRDTGGLSATQTVPITVGSNPPVATISEPVDGTVVKPGQTIQFSGSATDPEDGALNASSLAWNILLRHDDHVHPVIDASGTSGSFVIQDHDRFGSYSYEIILNATDSSGLVGKKTIRLPLDASGACFSTVSSGVTVCSPAPAAGETVTTPIRVVATASSGNGIVRMEVVLDGKLLYQTPQNVVDTFVPATDGAHQLAVRAYAFDGNVYTDSRNITASGKSGLGAPVAVPANVSFADQTLSTTSSSQTVLLRNDGGGAFNVASIIVSGDYSQTNNCPATLAAAQSCQITVVFQPTEAGVRPGNIAVASSAEGSPHTIWLSGTGTDPNGCNLSAPGVMLCSPANNAILNSPVRVIAKAKPRPGQTIDAFYIYMDNDLIQQLRGVESIDVTLPMDAGRHDITAQAWDSGGALFRTVAKIGVIGATPSGLLISSSALSFSSQAVGTNSASQPLTLSNTGTTEILLNSLSTTGDFLQANNCPATLAAGTNCIIDATFRPSATGERNGTLSISSSDPGSPLLVALTGTGTTSTCTLNTADRSVTICSPLPGAQVNSPVRITAGTTAANPVVAMKIYVDNVESYHTTAPSLDTNLAMSSGSHFIVVQAWDSTGAVFKSSVTVNAGGTSVPCTLSTVDKTVTICQPSNDSVVASPVRFVAGTTSSDLVAAIKIYVDNIEVYHANAPTLDTSLALSPGGHFVVIQAWDSQGVVFKSSLNVNVSDSASTCPRGTVDPSINICAPLNGANTSSPVQILAAANSSSAVQHMKVYVNDVEAYAVNSDRIDTSLALGSGTHYVVVQAWDAAGRVFKEARTITVGSGTASTCAYPPTAGINVCAPGNGSTVDNPVRLWAVSTPDSASAP